MTRKAKPPVSLYSALADATRCRIIEILTAGPVPVHKLAEAFTVSRPAISRHLRVLKTAGLVVEVKKGRENLYTLRAEKLTRAVEWIDALRSAGAQESAKPAKAKPAKRAQAPVSDISITTEAVSPLGSAPSTVADAELRAPVDNVPTTVVVAPDAVPSETERRSGKLRPARAKAPEPEIQQMGFEF